MPQNFQTAHDIVCRLRAADADELAVLDEALVADQRVTVRNALAAAHRRVEAEQADRARVDGLYDFQRRVSGGRLCVGLDEVGRGPLAGPLTVGAVVLPETPHIEGINDSKQLTSAQRERAAARVKEVAVAWAVFHVAPADIDAQGMARSLRKAFKGALSKVEEQGVDPQVVIVDGNPLHIDPREVNVVHGDARCASVACASIVAKVTRDAIMVEADKRYPGYGLASNKGYGSAAHMDAIRRLGLSPIHRASFCGSIHQDSLF